MADSPTRDAAHILVVMPPAPPLPRVVVLLATHNGARWLDDQLTSILDQKDVSVRIVALDDESRDTTRELLLKRAETDSRLTVLPSAGRAGSAARNFYRLMETAPIEPDEFVALSDQDDIWELDKLSRHARLLDGGGFDGVSSSVTSFTPDGQRTLIRKDYPQRAFDYLLEGPGPGSTFLFTHRLLMLARDALTRDDLDAREVEHDWFLYALTRMHGWAWHIDSEPSVNYRQHDDNVMGSNQGLTSGIARLKLIRNGWHRRQSALLSRLAVEICPPGDKPALERMHELLTSTGPRSRLTLAAMAGQLRRRPRDRGIIGLLIALGVW